MVQRMENCADISGVACAKRSPWIESGNDHRNALDCLPRRRSPGNAETAPRRRYSRYERLCLGHAAAQREDDSVQGLQDQARRGARRTGRAPIPGTRARRGTTGTTVLEHLCLIWRTRTDPAGDGPPAAKTGKPRRPRRRPRVPHNGITPRNRPVWPIW